MSHPDSDRDPLEQLAEEFIDRCRRGEHPEVSEYARRNPDLAERIRGLFPTLALVEECAADASQEARCGPVSSTCPTRLGEYRIVREIGRGGMGVVYEAVQESLGRHVALKVLPIDRSGKLLERFRREAKAAARLHHTNIVPVFGVGEDAGTHFYVMQFIQGRGLDRLIGEVARLSSGKEIDSSGADGQDDAWLSEIARGVLSGRFRDEPTAAEGSHVSSAVADTKRDTSGPAATRGAYYRTVARLAAQAADALHHAHSQGVLHRDVKPSNLLLDGRGVLWVTDFGLAKADDSRDLTDTGDLVGTLRYMAPERFRGRADERSDVYSLGVTLYELIALRPAFDAPDRLRLMEQIAGGSIVPLRRADPHLPRDLETIVARATAREPRDRYASAHDLAEDLGRFLNDLPIRARRAGPLEHLSRWRRRHPAVAGLAAALILLLVLAAAGGWWAAVRLKQQADAASQAERNTTERLREARLAQARAGRSSRLPGQRFKSLEAIAEAAHIRPSLELRNEAIACMALVDVRDERVWAEALETDRLEYSTGVAFDSDLEHYAYTDASGDVRVCSVEDEKVLVVLKGESGAADYLRFSPNGRYLAARHTRAPRPLRIWDWRASRLVLERSDSDLHTFSCDFHPDGITVAVGGRRKIDLFTLPDGRQSGSLELDFNPGWLAYEPREGGRLAVCPREESSRRQDTPHVATIDAGTGRPLADWRLPAMPNAVAWQPGGPLLAVSARDGMVYTFYVGANQSRAPSASSLIEAFYGKPAATISPPVSRPPLAGHLLEARELAFSPDGTLVVSRAWDGTTRFWDPHAGRELLRVRGASFLQFSRDGRRLAYRGYNSRHLGIWELASRGECRLLYGHRSGNGQGAASVAFAPGGALLASCAGDGVCLWETSSGRLLARLDSAPTRDVLIDPRGRYLVTCGERGVLHCALERSEQTDAEVWRVGPLRPLPRAGCRQPTLLHCDRDGERLVVVDRDLGSNQVLLVWPNAPGNAPLRLRGHANVAFAALSSDGRYLATGTSRGEGVKVWEADTGRLQHALPARETAGVAFSPDGARLFVLESEGTYRSYRVADWELEAERTDPDTGFTRGYRVAFDPSGRIMAQVHDRVNVRLVEVEDGAEVAVLQVPESQNVAGYRFSPDGRYLAAVTVRGVVYLWDVRHLREHLRAMGLDWSPPDEEPAPMRRPLRVEFVGAPEG
jgi:eukaryotic-like serine/threonine-protein kinase